MLRKHLEFHWRSHVLSVLTMVFLFTLTFSSITLLSCGERAVAQSARRSTPPSDFLVYIEVGSASDMAAAIGENPNVDLVHVDAWRSSEAISASGNRSIVLRNLPPEALRTQALDRGDYPSDPSQIAITYQLADALDVDLGSYITIAGDLVAERYLVTGIYARSPFDDRLDSAFEGLVLDANPGFVAAYLDDSGQGGIEVKGKSAVSAQEVMDDILLVGNSVVIRPTERYDLIYERHAGAMSAITVAVPWLLVTGFFVGTTVLFLSFVAGLQRRSGEIRNLRALGLKRWVLARMLITELGVITAISGVVGLGVSLALAKGSVAFLRSVPGAKFMPAILSAPASAYLLAALALLAAVAVATPLAVAVARSSDRYQRRRLTIWLVPLSVIVGAMAIYWSGLIPQALPSPLPLTSQVRSLALISALVAVGFALVIFLSRRLTSRMRLSVRTNLLPRSRVGLVRLLTLLVIFLASSALATVHVTTTSLAVEDVSAQDRFDVAVRSRLGNFDLTDYQVEQVRTWDPADRTLSLRVVETDLPTDGAFQPGPIYAVDPAEAQAYFDAPLVLDSRLLVPRGTKNIPDSVSFAYEDSARLVHTPYLTVVEANVPVALVSTRDVPGLDIDEMWVRLVPNAFETLSQTYPDFEERLGRDTPKTRPVITLSLGDDGPHPRNIGLLSMVVQLSFFAVLAFVVFVRVPRAFSVYTFENRNLRAMGLRGRTRQIRRLSDFTTSGFLMLVGGTGVGVASAWLILAEAGTVSTPLRIPWAAMSVNIAIILLACMTFGAISTRADVAQATNHAN